MISTKRFGLIVWNAHEIEFPFACSYRKSLFDDRRTRLARLYLAACDAPGISVMLSILFGVSRSRFYLQNNSPFVFLVSFNTWRVSLLSNDANNSFFPAILRHPRTLGKTYVGNTP